MCAYHIIFTLNYSTRPLEKIFFDITEQISCLLHYFFFDYFPSIFLGQFEKAFNSNNVLELTKVVDDMRKTIKLDYNENKATKWDIDFLVNFSISGK